MIERRPSSLIVVQAFFVALAVLLTGYMFLGRGFAHLGLPPLYVGEVVLGLGLVAAIYTLIRVRPQIRANALIWLLLALMAWGAIRTVPYLDVYGVDALRDAVLWGYALFALVIYVVVDRFASVQAFRWYGYVVPLFALWLPLSWTIFGILYRQIDPNRPGEVIPLVYFKSGDMAVHIVGAITFLVITAVGAGSLRSFLWRAVIGVPLVWTMFITWTSNRGALVAAVGGIAAAFLLVRHPVRWSPIAAGGLVAVLIFALPSVPISVGGPVDVPEATATARETPKPSVSSPTPRPTRTPIPTPEPTDPDAPGRQVGVGQLVDNVLSIFGISTDSGLTGTRAARLAWWGTIIDYTVFGPHFWTGKGFGINLATDDGFQPTADESLRAPHNSHLTALARMGVPGFLLWILVQGAFAFGLTRAVFAHRRRHATALAAIGAWVLVYWLAMMLNTSFDPYLEGPQGGIWFWSLFGLGLVVIRLAAEPSDAK